MSSCTSTWSSYIFQVNKINCHTIYLDFTKAFDKISHFKLLNVLKHFKINRSIINWTRDFLSNRTQQTVVENTHSESCKVTSGVPQGSVLGPLFFVLYLESLIRSLEENCPNTHIYAFADDVKLLGQDVNELNIATKIVETWSQNWDLIPQPKKSEHLYYSFSKPAYPNPANFYINNNLIPIVNSVKDLGITLSSNLKWTPYISKITSKANVLSYNILRSFNSTDVSLYSNLFKTYIRPLLEYNTPIWNPHLTSDIRSIERIQRKYTRMVCQKTNTCFNSYTQRLQIMKLDTLEMRRVRFDLIYFFKIFHKIVDIDFNKHFKSNIAMQNYSLRGHKFKLEHGKFSGSNFRNRFFCQRIIPLWNTLPNYIVESSNLDNFKDNLAKFNLEKIYTSKL